MRDATISQALERAQAENRVLSRVIEVLSSGVDVSQVLAAAVDLVLEATEADACFLHLYEGDRLVLRAASEPFRDAVGTVELALGEGVAGWVAEHRREAIIPDDKWSDARYKYIPALGGDRYTSMLSIPLISPTDQLVGVVNLHTEQRRTFTPHDVAFMSHVASLVAAAIEHAALFRELAAKEEALQRMVERTVQAQEEERRRVATEIHDGVTQQLISIWFRVQACERVLEQDVGAARGELEITKGLIDEALSEARAAIYDLRPSTLDDLGLVPAIKALVDRTFAPGVEVDVAADVQETVPTHLESALYRIGQELVSNIRRHAAARRVELTIEADPHEIRMRVTDDGRGFDLDAYRRSRPETSFGLTGISERVEIVGGTLDIRSEAAKGTQVEVRLPLNGRRRPTRLESSTQ
ncbi:MAG: GAF domain-containing sensor histidine kinase [Actinomycetota bacterium]